MAQSKPSDAATTPIDLDEHRLTDEVASEGGSPGDVELEIDRAPATGSEAGETLRPEREEVTEIHRDETGPGRRNP